MIHPKTFEVEFSKVVTANLTLLTCSSKHKNNDIQHFSSLDLKLWFKEGQYHYPCFTTGKLRHRKEEWLVNNKASNAFSDSRIKLVLGTFKHGTQRFHYCGAQDGIFMKFTYGVTCENCGFLETPGSIATGKKNSITRAIFPGWFTFDNFRLKFSKLLMGKMYSIRTP